MRFARPFLALIFATLIAANYASSQSSSPNSLLLALQPHSGGSYLGVRLTDIDADRAKVLRLSETRGAEIERVEEGSPAAEAGLKAGDVLLSYNGENIVGAQQLGRLVAETPEGRKVKLQVWRDGKSEIIAVTTGAPHAMNYSFPSAPNFEVPDVRDFNMLDVPNTLLVWKNSLLGFECETVDSQLARYFGVKHGVLIRSVEEGSAAGKAGLKAGDVLTAIADRDVSTPRDLRSYLRSEHNQGKSIPVEFTRERKPMKITIAISERRQ
jgi:serine protease Do